jgi:type I restriction enzyme S subunit
VKLLEARALGELPSGWTWARLGDLGYYWNGRGFKKSEWRSTGRQIIRIQDLTGTRDKPNYFQGEVDGRHVVRHGDLLVSWAATLGVYVWRGDEAVLNQHIFRVDPFIDKNFHRYLIAHVLEQLRQQTHGTGMVHITRDRFESTYVPLPPLPEQRRIVAAVEEQFSRIDAGVEALQRARRNLRRMREAVLQGAATGILLTHESEDASPKRRDGLPLVPSGWTYVGLDRILKGPLTNGRSVPDATNGFPVLRLTALRGGLVDVRERKTGAWNEADAKPFLVSKGDFLVARGNGSLSLVGRGGLVEADPGRIAYPDTMIRVRANVQIYSPRYLRLVWDSRIVRSQIERSARTTAGIYKINQATLRATILPMPPFQDQERIVAEAERVLSALRVAEEMLADNLVRAERLRRAVLTSAFEGRLVPQDPSDEPAEVLLDRIKATHPASVAGARLARRAHQ